MHTWLLAAATAAAASYFTHVNLTYSVYSHRAVDPARCPVQPTCLGHCPEVQLVVVRLERAKFQRFSSLVCRPTCFVIVIRLNCSSTMLDGR